MLLKQQPKSKARSIDFISNENLYNNVPHRLFSSWLKKRDKMIKASITYKASYDHSFFRNLLIWKHLKNSFCHTHSCILHLFIM